jgi:UEV domain
MYGSLKPKMDTYSKCLCHFVLTAVQNVTNVERSSTLAYDHGDTQLLLCLYGTTPITYRASPYNIPVAIWIPVEYPMSPPIFYVRPTSNMLVRPGINVDVSGFCYHSYLSTWKEDVVVRSLGHHRSRIICHLHMMNRFFLPGP